MRQTIINVINEASARNDKHLWYHFCSNLSPFIKHFTMLKILSPKYNEDRTIIKTVNNFTISYSINFTKYGQLGAENKKGTTYQLTQSELPLNQFSGFLLHRQRSPHAVA
jgi:hypothetical protein